MKVAIIGYGKMGKTIEQILLDRGHTVHLKINQDNHEDLTVSNLKSCDVAIEFTQPSSAIENYFVCFNAQVPVISGTTGWLHDLEKVKAQLQVDNATMFYAPNFSIGVNIFFKINALLAKIMNGQAAYNVEMEEIHHTEKLDSPSGTAIRTAEIILQNLDSKNAWVENVKSDESELLIKVKREDKVPGTHKVDYLSEEDKISISHTAFSRKGFALGAVLAAEWVYQKKGYYTMDDMLNL